MSAKSKLYSFFPSLLTDEQGNELEAIEQGLDRVTQGELSYRFPKGRTKEFRRLTDRLNTMLERLQDQLDEVSKQKNEQETILASMLEGVMAVDTEHKIILCNDAIGQLLSIDKTQVTGLKVSEVIKNAQLQRFITQVLEEENENEQELNLSASDNRIIQVYGCPIPRSDFESTAAVFVINDITRVRRLENVRKDFVANVSHELKTPITSIKGFVETLLNGSTHTEQDRTRFLEIILRHADRLNAIIEDLLILARLEDGDVKDRGELGLEEKSIHEVVQSAFELCEFKGKTKEIQFVEGKGTEISFPMNVSLFEQAISNLLENAVKYSNPGGIVEVSAESSNGTVTVHVKDNGVGIEEHHLKRLFERFYRVDKARSRDVGGTGLGLAIVKHIVQLHKGWISVDSTPGKGTTFSLHFSKV
ncbi:MAG: PAS domain-containing protein [Deltaproteobacteria bacterium]|nr:PAS domain-containing protein [Deltaproteobacteria bacterium]